MSERITITLTRGQVDTLIRAVCAPLQHLAKGCPGDPRLADTLRAALASPQPERYMMEEIGERLQTDETVTAAAELEFEEGAVANWDALPLSLRQLLAGEAIRAALSAAFPDHPQPAPKCDGSGIAYNRGCPVPDEPAYLDCPGCENCRPIQKESE